MYTSTKVTREQALKAAEAASRAMERYSCCKSQFKFRCFSCGEMINRGGQDHEVHQGLAYRDGAAVQGRGQQQWSYYERDCLLSGRIRS